MPSRARNQVLRSTRPSTAGSSGPAASSDARSSLHRRERTIARRNCRSPPFPEPDSSAHRKGATHSWADLALRPTYSVARIFVSVFPSPCAQCRENARRSRYQTTYVSDFHHGLLGRTRAVFLPEALVESMGYPKIELPEPSQVLGGPGDVILAHYMLGHISAAIMRVRECVELYTFACGGWAISTDGASACAMNCWSLIPSARLWIKREHDAGGAMAMAYNSPLQLTGGTARNLHVISTIECRWGSAARR
jgi:hypothetical protein